MKLSEHASQVVLSLATLIAIILFGSTANARDQAYRAIYKFRGSDGWNPIGVPAVAKNGDLYGVTNAGGHYNLGTVFKLTAPQTRGGTWTKSVLYDFPGGKGGGYPTSLVIGTDGNLYGVDYGQSIFELTPPSFQSSAWKYAVLYTLNQNSEGSAIHNLTLDTEGNLYDSAELGGDFGCGYSGGCGTIFRLKRPAQKGGKWRFNVLYTFTGNPDGAQPFAGVTFDQSGNLYGTTNFGGTTGYGAVYRLSPPQKKGQSWTETVPYSFDSSTGYGPEGPVIFDSLGEMYGTTAFGGDLNCQGGFGCGVVFQLSPHADKAGAAWTYATLYAFQGGNDGIDPTGYMAFDSTGSLYSTTREGGGGTGYAGIAFRLTPPARKCDAWTETMLHRFVAPEGAGPNAGLTWGKWGDLYGVTELGGIGCQGEGCGTVFELQP